MIEFRKISIIIVSFLLLFLFDGLPAELIKDKDIVSAVLDGDAPEFQNAVEYIKLNHPAAIPAKLKEEYLDDDDKEIRTRIITALREYPFQDQSALWTEMLRSAKDKDSEIELIDLLAGTKSVAFTVPIAEKLLVPRAEVREKAAMSLKKNGDDRVFPVILSLMQSKNPIDRIYFLEALNYLYDVRFQKIAISMLEDANKSVRIYAIKCVNNNAVKEALPALRKLVLKDDNNETRKMGIASLVSFKDTQSSPMLTGILKDQNAEVRLEAVRALGELKYYTAAGSLSEMLMKDEKPEIKDAVLDTLISFKKAGNIRGLKYIINNDPDPGMRIKAVYAIGEINEESASLGILKEAILDENYKVRGEACSALKSIKKGAVSEILINQIKTDKSRYVRSAALYSLVKINDSKNVIKFFDLYSTEEEPLFKEILRETVKNSLKKFIR